MICHGRKKDNRVSNSDNLVLIPSKNFTSIGESSRGTDLTLVGGRVEEHFDQPS